MTITLPPELQAAIQSIADRRGPWRVTLRDASAYNELVDGPARAKYDICRI
jgi:hypothetical protein